MTAPVVPLRPDQTQDQSTSPEALMISALIASGRFVPSEYHLTDEDLTCFTQLWIFCAEYQARSGRAPSLDLIRSKFPEFTFIPGIDLNWAADQLHEHAYGRTVRSVVTNALLDLSNNDYDAVRDRLATIPDARRRTRALAGLDIFDQANTAEDPAKLTMPVPWASLADHTEGGIGLDELWNVGGRFESGKSMLAAVCAALVAERGYTVKIISLEYGAKKYNRRIHRILARHDRALQLALRDHDPAVRYEALMSLQDRVPGSIETVDHSIENLDISHVEDSLNSANLTIVDHVGLLKLTDGTRSIEDWRPAAKISNMLREMQQRTHTALMNIVQTNRDSDTPGLRPPKVSQFSQTDALGQDCDVALMIKKPADTFQVHEIGKNRDNSHGLYYIRFDPEHGDFREIAHSDALNLLAQHQDKIAVQ